MKYLVILLTGLFASLSGHSQINEIGVFAGGSNFIGDVGATTYIAPESTTLGILYKWNVSSRHSWRASLIFSDLKGVDNLSDDPRRIERDYSFNINITELSTGLEFNFLDFNLHEGDILVTPYLYSGISVTQYENHSYFNGFNFVENDSDLTVGIPLVLGFKTNVLKPFILGFEIGARYTYSDDLDGSNGEFGNINNNDWYMFSGLTLTYTFGENACYCLQ